MNAPQSLGHETTAALPAPLPEDVGPLPGCHRVLIVVALTLASWALLAFLIFAGSWVFAVLQAGDSQ